MHYTPSTTGGSTLPGLPHVSPGPQVFLVGLPLRTLGEIEVPAAIAAAGMIVRSAPSYTSYKEMWEEELRLSGVRVHEGGQEAEGGAEGRGPGRARRVVCPGLSQRRAAREWRARTRSRAHFC
jgi:hypothetical protein